MATFKSSGTDKDVKVQPTGTGAVKVGTGAAAAVVSSEGDQDLTLQTGNATTGTITITDGANGDISISPNGTGTVVVNTDLDVDNININGNTISSTDTDGDINLTPDGTGTVVVNTDLDVDNLNINGNTISSTDTNGDINLTPDGTGSVVTSKADINGGNIDGTTIGGTTPAAGSFTSVDATSDVTIADKIVHSGDTDTAIRFPSADTLTVETAGTEAMRIDSDGNLLVGQTATSGVSARGGFMVQPNFDDGAARITFDRNTTSETSIAVLFRDAGLSKGTITFNNTSTSYNTSSDYRLKEDWQPMSGSIDRLKALNPVNFAWKSDGSRVDGFLAHEAQEVVPEAVSGEKDAVDADGNPEYQGVDYGRITPLLTSALQDAIEKIEMLEMRIAELEAR